MTQVPIEPMARSAQPNSPSQPRAQLSGATSVSSRLNGPLVGVEPHERLGDHDAGDHLRQEQHRAEEREAAHQVAGHHAGQRQAEHDREHRVPEDQLERVPVGDADVGVGERLRVVVEADELADRDAVPLVQRQPRRVQQREEREQDEEREPRQDVEPRDVARLARGPAGATATRGAAPGAVAPGAARPSTSTGGALNPSAARRRTSTSPAGWPSWPSRRRRLAGHHLLEVLRERVVHRRRRPVGVQRQAAVRDELLPRRRHLTEERIVWPAAAAPSRPTGSAARRT